MQKYILVLVLSIFGSAFAVAGDFEASGGASLGFGSAGTGTSIQRRATDTFGLWVAQQYNFNSLISAPVKLGLYGSFGITGDMKVPDGFNLGGNKLAAGISVGYAYDKFTAIAAFVPFSSYSLKKQTAGNLDAKFGGATGFALVLGYQPWKEQSDSFVLSRLSFDLVGEYTSYSNQTIGSGTSTELPSGDKFSMWSAGIGASFRY